VAEPLEQAHHGLARAGEERVVEASDKEVNAHKPNASFTRQTDLPVAIIGDRP
jgi:hypothetical protein